MAKHLFSVLIVCAGLAFTAVAWARPQPTAIFAQAPGAEAVDTDWTDKLERAAEKHGLTAIFAYLLIVYGPGIFKSHKTLVDGLSEGFKRGEATGLATAGRLDDLHEGQKAMHGDVRDLKTKVSDLADLYRGK